MFPSNLVPLETCEMTPCVPELLLDQFETQQVVPHRFLLYFLGQKYARIISSKFNSNDKAIYGNVDA